ncbi:MAG: AAA family ATPase [Rhodobacteraceae bacterium]|nr:AAA family ATPase [Paracoccaceae bacterium]
MNLKDFINLPKIDDIDTRIEAQERDVAALKQVEVLRKRPALSEFPVPKLPEDFTGLLARTIDDIAQDSERMLSEHLTKHGMEGSGGKWVADGLLHADDTCPFCGQDIRGLPLIAAFRAVFSKRYKDLAAKIATMKGVACDMRDKELANLDAITGQNNDHVKFWQQYCEIKASALALPRGAVDAIRGMAGAAIELLDRKAARPLDPITPDEKFTAVRDAYKRAAEAIKAANAAIRETNHVIAGKKATADTGDLESAEGKLIRLKASQTRHQADVSALCADYTKLGAEKSDINKRKEKIRKRLNEHTETVVKPYEDLINDYLMKFGADFSITKTKHTYPSGVATSDYQILINETAVDLGNSKTPGDIPSFRNTLSAGDRSALALAFFLAQLERDPTVAKNLVVFDDPFNSQDAFRRQQTVHEIIKVAGKCAQVIVLSHDATFLKQVWDKSPKDKRVALETADQRVQGSKLRCFDIDKACRSRTMAEIDDLQAYLTHGKGNERDIIRKMRPVLETYCRKTYPDILEPGASLGAILAKIRESDDQHPAKPLCEELDDINDYTNRYHHGENGTDATPDQIDPVELKGYVQRTLDIVKALPA